LLAVVAGRPTLDRTHSKLKRGFPGLPAGPSESDRRRNSSLPPGAHETARTPEALAKRSRSLRQQRAERRAREAEILGRAEDDPERIALLEKKATISAHMSEAQRNSEAAAEHRRNHAEFMRSMTARAWMSIRQNLIVLERQRPDSPLPTPAERRKWERRFAARLQQRGVTFSTGELHECWKRAEVDLGLRRAGGAPLGETREDRRCRILEALMSEMQWPGRGDVPHRFNVILSTRLEMSFSGSVKWRKDHLARCPRHSGAVA